MFSFSIDMYAVQAICLVVAGVEKANALNFALAQRYTNFHLEYFYLSNTCFGVYVYQ